MTQQPWLEPTDDDLTKRGEHPYQRADQVELHGDSNRAPQLPAVAAPAPPPAIADESRQAHQFVLAIVSLGVGIPLTAIAASNVTPSLLGVIIVWLGIVGVNVAHGLIRRG